MKASDSANTASPRPWTWYLNQDEQLIVCDKNGNEVAQVFVGEDDAQLICNAVNGEDAELSPLPYGTKEAAQEANRRYLETKQEFWAGLADHLFDAVAVSEYREHDRAEVNRLRDELCQIDKILEETGKQKLDALFEVSKLRNLIKRLLPYAEQRLAELHTPTTPFLVEARQALEEEDGQ